MGRGRFRGEAYAPDLIGKNEAVVAIPRLDPAVARHVMPNAIVSLEAVAGEQPSPELGRLFVYVHLATLPRLRRREKHYIAGSAKQRDEGVRTARCNVLAHLQRLN